MQPVEENKTTQAKTSDIINHPVLNRHQRRYLNKLLKINKRKQAKNAL